jgi:D-xylose transport system ATP-binding protein
MAQQVMPDIQPAAPILEMSGIEKSFFHVRALAGVHMNLMSNEILGVVGDNGAGKSTLMKVLSGVVIADKGSIRIDGTEVVIRNPDSARRLGIAMVYQDLALFDNLDVASNIFLRREVRKLRVFQAKREMYRRTTELLRQLHVNVPSPKLLVQQMSGGQRQMIACAKAIAFPSRILIMDEPTAALGVSEANALLSTIERLKQSHAVLLVTQRIPDVLAIADRVLVIKNGKDQGILNTKATTLDDVVELIIKGREGVDSGASGHRSFG